MWQHDVKARDYYAWSDSEHSSIIALFQNSNLIGK